MSNQSGFRSLHSTVTALLESTNNWAYNIDHGRVNAVVSLDLRKAFDTVDHGILPSKLNAYGLGGAVGTWFKSYLSDRSQKCSVNGHFSNNRTLICGIPQGTILAPLLFLLYINDLPNCLEHSQAQGRRKMKKVWGSSSAEGTSAARGSGDTPPEFFYF